MKGKIKFKKIKSGEPIICEGRMYVIKTVENATQSGNLENGQNIFTLHFI